MNQDNGPEIYTGREVANGLLSARINAARKPEDPKPDEPEPNR